MIGADTVYDADWVPVSIGLAVASGLCCYKIFYNLYLGNIELSNSENELSTTESIKSTDSSNTDECDL